MENNYGWVVVSTGSLEGTFLAGGSSTLINKEDLGMATAELLESLLNAFDHGDLDAHTDADGNIDLGELSSEEREILKNHLQEATNYAYGKRDQVESDYFTTNEFGKLLGETLEIIGVDGQGNPVYSVNKGAGDWIRPEDKVVLSDNGQTFDVYTKDGDYLASLDINGNKSDYISV